MRYPAFNAFAQARHLATQGGTMAQGCTFLIWAVLFVIVVLFVIGAAITDFVYCNWLQH